MFHRNTQYTRYAQPPHNADHKVKIWNFEMVTNDQGEGAKLLAAMEGHGGPVNCVRFSPDGRFLATASDDHMVLLWELRSGPAAPVFGTDDTNVENWCRSVTLSGHTTRMTKLPTMWLLQLLTNITLTCGARLLPLDYSGQRYQLVSRWKATCNVQPF